MLCYLAERDPDGLRSALRLGNGSLEIVRERTIKSGRIDIVVLIDTRPAAIVEVKLGADAHGDQFSVYDDWADERGVPPEQRYILSPSADAISDVPDAWSQLTIRSLLRAWQDSDDDLARMLATEAINQFTDLERQATGPADASTVVLADVLRLRRLQHRVWSEASSEVWFGTRGRSRIGAPNITAWCEAEGERVTVELQRFEPRAGVETPFAFKIMVREGDGTDEAATVELARTHEDWMAPRRILRGADNLRSLVTDPNADGLKPGRAGKGHERYYGYKYTGLGTVMHVRPDITLEQLVQLYAHVVDYLTTYRSAPPGSQINSTSMARTPNAPFSGL